MDLASEPQKIYDSEINVRIGFLWDGGIDVWLGDELNGYLAQDTVTAVSDIAPWLQEAIATSTRNQIIQYPWALTSGNMQPVASSYHRGSLPPGMEELLAFVCPNCGNAVKVEKPKIQ